ncbi:hypothetical protein DPEC_G00021950 [Dallia pectoralis]|uniref:Uncharacterized protein n=1 Tax=Dallia pectoralis TaxID=75939 RepID=A0ACC2HGD9_DALPE|nr:hypothetical protein DPEC_G00021950 [Dallia pectoralis]
METPLHLTIVLTYRILILLLITGLSFGLSRTAFNLQDEFGDSAWNQNGHILSPLLKALREQGHPWRDTSPRMKPESKYVRYMKRLYRMSLGHERSSEGNDQLYNTVRLITPRDECIEQTKEFFMQDLSYNLDRVRDKEQLLKSVLLYSFDQDQASPITTQCYLDVKEPETFEQCPLCSSAHHSVNFLFHTDRRSRRKWVEVDITAFLRPLIQSQKKNIHLIINLNCVESGGAKDGGEERSGRGPVELHLRSPSLLLYLNDTSELAHQRRPPALPTRSEGHPRSGNEMGTPESVASFNPEQKINWSEKRARRRRESPSKHSLPELRPSSEFVTSDCALYDFRYNFLWCQSVAIYSTSCESERSFQIGFLDTMGRHFGNLAKIRHVITYSLSPFEQRAFPNYFSKGIPNVWRRFSSSFFRVAPPMILAYVTYTWGNQVYLQGKRKIPADYENDE